MPETFFLAKGKIKLVVKDVKTKEKKEFIVTENHLIEIPPMVYREVHALTDSMLIEFNTEVSDFKDETIKGRI